MPDQSDVKTTVLAYDRSAGVRVRGYRTLIFLTLLNTAALGWFILSPQLTPIVQRQWQQWQAKREMRRQETQLLATQKQCMTHTIPAGTVAYTEDRALAATLAGQRKQYQTVPLTGRTLEGWVAPAALSEPPFWTTMRGLKAIRLGYETANPYPMIFLHERTTPGGEKRVVVVQWVAGQLFRPSAMMDEGDHVETSRLLAARMHSLASRGVPAHVIDHVQVRVRLPAPDSIPVRPLPARTVQNGRFSPLTVFAGEPDPADGSHFTIPYTIGAHGSVIDGWVTGNELILKPRAGESAVVGGQQTWILRAMPTPPPASTRAATAPAARP